MMNILCFGDSNTWGYAPETGARFGHDVRWTGVLQSTLGRGYRVIEEGLNGRTTDQSEQLRPHRNGAEIIPMLLESHAPLDLVVVMLGTNDLKAPFDQTAQDIARGAGTVCDAVLSNESLTAGQCGVLLIAPTLVGELSGEDALDFAGARAKSLDLATHYRAVASARNIHFFDAAKTVRTSPVDGVHWDADQHAVFGRKLAGVIRDIFGA